MQSDSKSFTGYDQKAVKRAIDAFRRGGMVVVTDSADRENEGDLICPADAVDADRINFMARFCRGLICVPMHRAELERLGLSRMISTGEGDRFDTAFMESVDAREGTTTGISAHDRARTVEVLLDENSGPRDLVRPGHIFPLAAMDGGVLERPGHTEAAVDLAVMAGRKPAGVICEILREDGAMARRPELESFAGQHGLPLLAIEDLVAYRRRHEKLVHLEREVDMPTGFGMFRLKLYYSHLDHMHHLAMVMGRPQECESALVRIHSECLTGDVLESLRCDCGSQLREAMRRIAGEGHGVLLYMRQEGRGIGLAHKIHAYALQESGMDTVEANIHLGFGPDLREYGSGAQILSDLGLRRIRLMTNNPRKIEGLEQYGMEIVERVALLIGQTPQNSEYMRTKKDKMGHIL